MMRLALHAPWRCLLALAPLLAGCLPPAGPTTPRGRTGNGEAKAGPPSPRPAGGILFFHGMVQTPADVRRQLAPVRDFAARAGLPLLAPDMYDGAADDMGSWRIIEGFRPLTDASGASHPPWELGEVIGFLRDRERVTVSGYSLGRVPFYHLLQDRHAGVERAVLFDPTYNLPHSNKAPDGGRAVRRWLEADPRRRFVLVYGPATRMVGGKTTFDAALIPAPAEVARRASFCYFALGHEEIIEETADALAPGWADAGPSCETVDALTSLSVGGWARVVGRHGVNLRRNCDLAAPPVRDAPLPPGSIHQVRAGPEVADGHIWWRLALADGTTGCAAERDTEGQSELLETTAAPGGDDQGS